MDILPILLQRMEEKLKATAVVNKYFNNEQKHKWLC